MGREMATLEMLREAARRTARDLAHLTAILSDDEEGQRFDSQIPASASKANTKNSDDR
jgi:hypothetical protein